MTALGWAALVTAAVSAIAGIALGWAELIALAVVVAAALMMAAFQAIGRSTYAVNIDVPQQRVRVGERAGAQILIRNAGRRRVLSAQMEVPIGAGTAAFFLPSLTPGAMHDELLTIPTSRRGVITLGPAQSVRGDALGLMRREVRWTDPVELFVHPEIVRLDGAGSGILRDLEGQSILAVSDSDISFHALREYVSGDDRRHIHWKTSARVGDLMVRQFDDTRRTRTALMLSTHPDDYVDANEFELAVSVFSSLGVQALREDRDIVALAGTDPIRVDAAASLLDGCSRLDLSEKERSSKELAPWVVQRVPDASIVMVVVGSKPTPAQLRQQVALIDKGMMVLLLRCERGAGAEVRRLGDATAVRIGALGDFPRILRRIVA